MAKWRKKPVIVDAYQWFSTDPQNGDVTMLEEQKVVGDMTFVGCIKTLEDTEESAHYVCESDYIITGVKGEKYACKEDIFLRTYEPVPKRGRPAKNKTGVA